VKSINKNDFITAYMWMYGSSKKEAEQVYRKVNKEYQEAIIDGFKQNAKQAFIND